ncbi:MAG: helix-turn-helix domain-containing protein [Gemmatimonadota bacterium]
MGRELQGSAAQGTHDARLRLDVHARLRQALQPIPDGALVPVEWVRGLVEECGGEAVDLTVEDVAVLMNRGASTIRTWCASGRLPGSYRLQGREWRVPRTALQALRNGAIGAERRSNGRPTPDLGEWRKHIREVRQ